MQTPKTTQLTGDAVKDAKELERFLRMLCSDVQKIETEVKAARGTDTTLDERLTNGGI